MKNDKFPILIACISCVGLFLGRSWMHVMWDAPFRTIFWDENLLQSFIESNTAFTWNEYVTSPVVDQFIQNLIVGFGWFYLICAFASVGSYKLRHKPRSIVAVSLQFILWLGAISLIILAALYCKEKFFSIGQFFEYSCQFLSPVFLIFLLRDSITRDRLIRLLKIAIALTFTCHGLYAIGFYPRPGLFVDMTINILHVNEANAVRFLNLAGILDFVISILIFVPRFAKPALFYAVLWGSATAIARVAANFYWSNLEHTFGYWFWEMLYRLPHALVPVLVLYLLSSKGNTSQLGQNS